MDNRVATIRAERFAIILNSMPCFACRANTRVSALLVEDANTRLELDEPWETTEGAALLSYIQEIDEDALNLWRKRAPWVELRNTKTSGTTYYVNTCEHCHAPQGDWFLTEADGPFFPTIPAASDAIRIHWQEHPLSARANYGQSSWMDALARRLDQNSPTRANSRDDS